MKFSTRLKYIFATLLMGAVVVFDHVWGGWLPDDYPYVVWIHYGLLVPVGFCLAVSLGMNTGNPERSVFAVTCGVAATVLLNERHEPFRMKSTDRIAFGRSRSLYFR